MVNSPHLSFLVPDKSYFGLVKREIEKLLTRNDFSEAEIGKVNIIVSEITSNFSKHANKGQELLIKFLGNADVEGIEILGLDTGPGMTNPLRMLEDGVSTAGTAGQGLGAIKRLSDEFNIYSSVGFGTVILSRFYKKEFKNRLNTITNKLSLSAVMVPLKGENESGDGFAIAERSAKTIILTLDGLGHGPDAHDACNRAIEAFNKCNEELPNAILRLIDLEIKKTRGAVGSVTSIDNTGGRLLYCGVGNISGRLVSNGESRSLVSYNGTLGYIVPNTLNNHVFEWDDSKLLILHSDGLKTKWDVMKNCHRLDTSVIASALYKDNTRRTDDALVITARTSKL